MEVLHHNRVAPTTVTSPTENGAPVSSPAENVASTVPVDPAANKAVDDEKWKFLSFLTRPEVTEYEIFLLGMAMVLGTQNNSWNISYDGGFDAVLFNVFYVGSGYICLCLCLAEMSSALPFSGGIYGFVRAASGPYYGYVVACFETLFNIVYISALVDPLATIPHEIGGMPDSFTPAFIFIIYFVVLVICLLGGKTFWSVNAVLGTTCIVLMMIYLGGSLVDVNTHSSFTKFCKKVPLTAWAAMNARQGIAHQFLGVQYLPLNSKYLKNPKQQMPRIIVLSILLLFVNALFLAFAVCSQPPGVHELAQRPFPLDYGFAAIFHTSVSDGIWLHVPGMFAGIFGFIYCYGKQLYSISKSGLLPSIFTNKIPVLRTPYVSLIFGCTVCFGINILLYRDPAKVLVLKGISSLCNQIIFVNACIGYILFRIKYSNIEKSFTSPLGIYGAIWGIINYSEGCIAIIFFHGKDYAPIVTVIVYLIIVTLFYIFYMSQHQVFSEEEKQVLFKMYLINANRANHNKVHKHHQIEHHSPAKSNVMKGQNSPGLSSSNEAHLSTDIPVSSSNPGQHSSYTRVSSSNQGRSSSDNQQGISSILSKEHPKELELHSLHSHHIVVAPSKSTHISQPALTSAADDIENHVSTSPPDKMVVYASSGVDEDIQNPDSEPIPSESTKNVVALLATTLKTISKSFLQAKELEDYRALAVLQEGGDVDPQEEEVLKEKFSLHSPPPMSTDVDGGNKP